ncbi:MAG: hypothetical protein V4636_05360 [Pseudomonadota bacterium]
MKAAKPKRPAQGTSFAFARYVDDSGQITGWQLFRRASVDRRLFGRMLHTPPTLTRGELAAELWQARIVLRAVVDNYEFKKMGVLH